MSSWLSSNPVMKQETRKTGRPKRNLITRAHAHKNLPTRLFKSRRLYVRVNNIRHLQNSNIGKQTREHISMRTLQLVYVRSATRDVLVIVFFCE